MGLRVIGGLNTRIVYLGRQITGSNASSYSFGGVGLSEAWPRRHIIVGFNAAYNGGAFTRPSVTNICGEAPSLVVSEPSGDSAGDWWQLWVAHVPTNTSNTIQASRAASMTHGAIMVWAAYDLTSGTPVDAQVGGLSNPSSVSLNMQSRGVAVGFSAYPSGQGDASWSGLSENDEATGSGTASARRFSGASIDKAAAGSLAVSVSTSGNHRMIAASWK